jgi:hypothetical protein
MDAPDVAPGRVSARFDGISSCMKLELDDPRANAARMLPTT